MQNNNKKNPKPEPHTHTHTKPPKNPNQKTTNQKKTQKECIVKPNSILQSVVI